MKKNLKYNREKKVYNKANSFTKIASDVDHKSVLARINNLYDNINNIESDFKETVKLACEDILGKPNNRKNIFTLQTMVLAEIERVENNNLARYLNYRYRYDVYPQEQYISDFPPLLIDVIKNCLRRHPDFRPTVDELSYHPFINYTGKFSKHEYI